jgi:cobaltochelatase CobN
MGESEEEISEDFDHFLHELEEFINETSSLAQPIGLHVFGTYPNEKNLTTTIIQMLGKEYLEKTNGKDYAKNDYQEFDKSKAYKLIKDYVIDNKDINTLEDKEFKFYIKEAKRFKALFENQKEDINLFRALNGEHIKSGNGGGPIRNPESLPTGVNMVSFDPSKVPSKAAYETGKVLMDDFINEYYEKNGEFPSKITYNLWGLETVRHHGVMESQIMAAMGVRPIWNENGVSNEFMQGMLRDFLSHYIGNSIASWISKKITLNGIEYTLSLTPDTWFEQAKRMIKQFASNGRGRVKDVEIIPYSELKRPRVDVVLSVTGLYRDTFPGTMKLLAKAVKKIALLKEDSNHIYLNAKVIQDELESKGIDKAEALRLSTIRIFSNKTGTYGSGVDEIQESGKWESDEVISKKYFKIRGYYFGDDESKWDEQRNDINLFGQNLSGSQSVIFSRSSNLYGLLTSDDPYGLFGSLSMAIRKLDGTNPKTYISNLRDPNNAKIQTTAKFMAQELRSRYFHPNWIKEMKKEGSSGAQEVSTVVSNFWGWQVVDPDIVRGDQWDEFINVYIEDKYNLDLKEWFKQENPQALANMTEKMIEAYRKDYWDANKKTIKKLLELHQELEKEFNVKSFNLKFKEFKKKAGQGFGLASLRQSAQIKPETKPKTEQEKANEKAKVKGQKLEKQTKQIQKQDNKFYFIFAGLLFVILSGLYYGYRKE